MADLLLIPVIENRATYYLCTGCCLKGCLGQNQCKARERKHSSLICVTTGENVKYFTLAKEELERWTKAEREAESPPFLSRWAEAKGRG